MGSVKRYTGSAWAAATVQQRAAGAWSAATPTVRSAGAWQNGSSTPPTFGSSGAVLAGASSTAANVAVPAGVAVNDIVLALLYVETTQAVTPPAGFAEAPNSPVVVSAGAQSHDLRIFWKRATGADSGTYNFTIAAGVSWRSGVAVRVGGCVTTGNPFDVTNSAAKTTTTTGATAAVQATTTGANRLLVWAGACFNGGGAWGTVPNFTERVDPGGGESFAIDTLAQPVAGSTGSLTAAYTVSGATSAWLGALLPSQSAPPPPPVMNRLKIPITSRVRGVDIAPTFNGINAGLDANSVWSCMWRVWDWAGRFQPQLDDAATVGNCVRMFGNTHVVASGNITLATYLARWKQFLDYCVVKGLWVYPTGGDFGHWGNCNWATTQNIYGQLYDLLATYTNIVGFDITNEAWGEMHPNNFDAARTYQQPEPYRDVSQWLIDLGHARLPGVPLTNSFSLADNAWWNWDGPAGNDWASLQAMGDFLDFHVYTSATPAQAASAYQRPWATGKYMLIGEFGGSDPGGGGGTRINEVKNIVNARSDTDGALYWTCWDLGNTASTLSGLFDGNRQLRAEISVPFSTMPTTR